MNLFDSFSTAARDPSPAGIKTSGIEKLRSLTQASNASSVSKPTTLQAGKSVNSSSGTSHTTVKHDVNDKQALAKEVGHELKAIKQAFKEEISPDQPRTLSSAAGSTLVDAGAGALAAAAVSAIIPAAAPLAAAVSAASTAIKVAGLGTMAANTGPSELNKPLSPDKNDKIAKGPKAEEDTGYISSAPSPVDIMKGSVAASVPSYAGSDPLDMGRVSITGESLRMEGLVGLNIEDIKETEVSLAQLEDSTLLADTMLNQREDQRLTIPEASANNPSEAIDAITRGLNTVDARFS